MIARASSWLVREISIRLIAPIQIENPESSKSL